MLGRRQRHVLVAGEDLMTAVLLVPLGERRGHVHLLDNVPPADARVVSAEGDFTHLRRVRNDAHLGAAEVVVEHTFRPNENIGTAGRLYNRTSNMQERTTCRTVLLDDSPSNADSFGPHAKIAEAIAEIIRSQSGGRAIGLSGKWGAGKSTVIEQLRRQFAGNNSIVVFVFDAWAHEGDPLRRTFLERLVTYLMSHEWLQTKKWKENLNVLGGRLTRTEKHEVSRPTPFGVLLSGSLLLVPIGAALFGDLLDHWGDLYPSRLFLSLTFMLAPALVSAANGLMGLATRRELSDVWAVVAHPGTVRVTTESHEGEEPTSVEFEIWFNQIITECLDVSDRRLIIVLDNLDRVTADTATTVWTALQTFVASTGSTGVGLQRTWFIVPYDKDQLSRTGEKRNSDLVRSFIAKRIAIEFHVPEPVLSDWREYCLACLAEGFPDHKADDFAVIYDVFLATRESVHAPTPRDIKQFVNQLGALHRIRQDEFELADVAYFTVLRLNDASIVEGLLAGTIPAPRLRGLTSDRVADAISALHFGVRVDEARQLLLRAPIENALRLGDATRLTELRDRPGFHEVLQGINFMDWLPAQSAALARSCVALHGAGLLPDSSVYESTTSRLFRALPSVESWNLTDEQVPEGLAIAIDRFGEDFAREIIRLVSVAAIQGARFAYPGPIESWAHGAVKLFRVMKARGYQPLKNGAITIPGESADWFNLSSIIVEDGDADMLRSFVPPHGFADVVSVATSRVNNSGVIGSDFTVDKLRALLCACPEADWPTFWQAIQMRIQAPENPDAGASIQLLLNAIEMEDRRADEVLSEVTRTGWVHHHLERFLRTGTGELSACVVTLMRTGQLFEAPPSVGKSSTGHTRLLEWLREPAPSASVITEVASFDNRTSDLSKFITSAYTTGDARPLARSLTIELARQHRAGAFVSAEEFIQNWPSWKEIVPQKSELKIIIAELAAAGLVTHLTQSRFEPQLADLYRIVGFVVGFSTTAFGEWCASGVRELPATEWENAIKNNQELVDLAADCKASGVALDLGGGYAVAVISSAKELATSGDANAYIAQNATTLLALSLKSQSFFREGLMGCLMDLNGMASAVFFDSFRHILDDSRIVLEERRVVDRVLIPILSKQNLAGIAWITRVFAGSKTLSKELLHFEQFEGVLRAELNREEIPESLRTVLFQLAATIGIEPFSGS
jgi:hypothetical protein